MIFFPLAHVWSGDLWDAFLLDRELAGITTDPLPNLNWREKTLLKFGTADDEVPLNFDPDYMNE